MIKTRIALLVAALAIGLSTGPAFAKQDSHDEGKGKGHSKGHNKNKNKHEAVQKVYFNDSHRGHVTSYYREEYRGGHCPPGLAKKNNGCMPPGQAKKWRVGQPLPSSVVIYELPPSLVVKLGPPPVGQQYCRVGADILLIAIGTRVVIDAMSDLSRI